jgi:hydrocephalus-inducing protein
VCITEREKFVVPVRAIGARALLDFPDKVHFSASPVKVIIFRKLYRAPNDSLSSPLQYCSTKTVLVRNVGNKEAKFNIEAQRYTLVCMNITIHYP